MINYIQEKNNKSIVALAFRCKFLRESSPEELIHWINIFKNERDFPKFLILLANTANTGNKRISISHEKANQKEIPLSISNIKNSDPITVENLLHIFK